MQWTCILQMKQTVKKKWIMELDRFICAWCVHCLLYIYVLYRTYEKIAWALLHFTLYTYSNIWSFFFGCCRHCGLIHQTMEKIKDGEWKTSFFSLFRYVNQGNCYCIVVAYRISYFQCCHCCWVPVFSSFFCFFFCFSDPEVFRSVVNMLQCHLFN